VREAESALCGGSTKGAKVDFFLDNAASKVPSFFWFFRSLGRFSLYRDE
jgi:hypothetical protein